MRLKSKLTAISIAIFISAAHAALADDAAPPPPPVTVAKPIVRDVVDNDEFIGRFQAVDSVAVRSRVGG